MAAPRPIVAVVLAAGSSTRFGDSPKQLVEVDGTAMVTIAATAAIEADCFDAVVVVEGAVALAGSVPDGATVVANDRWAEGMATSLAAGIDHARSISASAVVVGLADQPGIGAAAWREVALAETDRPIAIATYDGVRGNPVRLSAEVWDVLPTTGDEGARSIARLKPELVAEVACTGDPRDVDTREDLERWN